MYDFDVYAPDPRELWRQLGRSSRRILLVGAAGTGKSTLAAGLAQETAAGGRACHCLSADPGTPAFGLPGTVSLGQWRANHWQLRAVEPLCSLDAGRFRLPLVAAVRRLIQSFAASCAVHDCLLVDAPGLVRGVAARELLQALAGVSEADTVLVLSRDGKPPLGDHLAALSVPVYVIKAAQAATRPGKRQRERIRTAPWDEWLLNARRHELATDGIKVIGTPPPLDAAQAWPGRQIALFDETGSLETIGEVSSLRQGRLTVQAPADELRAASALVRDARRNPRGMLASAPPFAAGRFDWTPADAAQTHAALAARVGICDIELVNGVFGDPLLHIRIRHRGRSLLFDLGEGRRLSARLAHQVTDVCISHAHMDHLGGFLWLLRSRLGFPEVCRLYGPPGLAQQVRSLINGFLWDRIGEAGPEFEVAELHGDELRRCRVKAGHAATTRLDTLAAPDGLLRREEDFTLRAVQLDHHTPVLAFALEPAAVLHIRKDELTRRGLKPGPWLHALKAHMAAGDMEAELELPDGSREQVAELAAGLVIATAGKRLVYATDLDDSADNRARLSGLARNAHTLICEAPFTQADLEQARRHGHLTARACGEIAAAAGVSRLVPFHFSRRYEGDPTALVEELSSAFERLELPWPQ